MSLDLNAIERLAREALDTPFRVAAGADRDCFTAFATLGPAHTLALIAALRAVLDTSREELAAVWSGAFVDPLVAPRVAEQALAYLTTRAGIA